MWKPFKNRPNRQEIETLEALWASLESLRDLVHKQGRVINAYKAERDEVLGFRTVIGQYDTSLDDIRKQLIHLRENKADLGHKHSS